MSTEAIVRQEPVEKKHIAFTGSGIQFTNMTEAMRFCEAFVGSGLAPKNDTAQTVLIKLQAGLEMGLKPMRALAVLCVINGRLSIEGKGLLGLIRSKKIATVKVYNEGSGETLSGVFEFKRHDTGEEGKVVFTAEDAKGAGLWNKKGRDGQDTPWTAGYRADMMIWRAVSRGANRYFSDITLGIEASEVTRELSAPSAEPPTVERVPPSTPDPLLARVVEQVPYVPEPAPEGMSSHSDAEIPFASHQEADQALADEDGQGRLMPKGRGRRE